ncbi:hypothetical protein BKA59DRAFT_29747 [Fusarium tricinctum]|uniref:Uncharacterized protein n=1 Tax=Fusarium tricinctum TaxID=61284 RepID=A0A8K0S9W5_9HYPO|nr:hypothetical protein BKA59DRAFT_29747 [Fusarium tricinctum]
MYIPVASQHLHVSVADTQRHGSLQNPISALMQPLMKLSRNLHSQIGQYSSTFDKRQFSDNPSRNNNIKIGLIVGFTLAAFLAIVATFLYFYYRSARFTFRKKKHRRHHGHHRHHQHPHPHRRHKSMSSGGSRGSDRSAAPPPRPPTDAPPPDKPTDG